MQVLFLRSHSTCFERKRPSSGVFKTSTAATGTCVIVAGKSSHLLIRAEGPVAAVLVLNTPDDGRLRPKHVEWLCRNKTCTVLHQDGVSFVSRWDVTKYDVYCCNTFPLAFQGALYLWWVKLNLMRTKFVHYCNEMRFVHLFNCVTNWWHLVFCWR